MLSHSLGGCHGVGIGNSGRPIDCQFALVGRNIASVRASGYSQNYLFRLRRTTVEEGRRSRANGSPGPANDWKHSYSGRVSRLCNGSAGRGWPVGSGRHCPTPVRFWASIVAEDVVRCLFLRVGDAQWGWVKHERDKAAAGSASGIQLDGMFEEWLARKCGEAG